MSERIAYDQPIKARGRPAGTKNKLGHRAGRPSNGNGQRRVVHDVADDACPVQKMPAPPIRPLRVAYDTPMPAGARLGGGNGGVPAPPPKPLPPCPASPGVIKSVAQAGINPDLITTEELLLEIQALATSDIADWPDCPKTLRDAPEHFRRAVSGVRVYLEKDSKGQPLYDHDGNLIYRYEITLWNKNAAQDQLGRYHGVYARDKVPIQLNQQFNQLSIGPRLDLSSWPADKLAQLEDLLHAATEAVAAG